MEVIFLLCYGKKSVRKLRKKFGTSSSHGPTFEGTLKKSATLLKQRTNRSSNWISTAKETGSIHTFCFRSAYNTWLHLSPFHISTCRPHSIFFPFLFIVYLTTVLVVQARERLLNWKECCRNSSPIATSALKMKTACFFPRNVGIHERFYMATPSSSPPWNFASHTNLLFLEEEY